MTPQLRRNLTYGGAAIAVLIVAGLGAVVYRVQRPDQRREVTIPADLLNPPAAAKKPGEKPANPTNKARSAALSAGVPKPPAAVPGIIDGGKIVPGGSAPPLPPKPSKTGDTEPRFDVVRVERNGESVVAGRAAPNSVVKLLSNGKVAASAKTDSAGQFVMIPEALKPGNHQLTLRATDGGGHDEDSKQAVVVSVPKTSKDKLLVVTEEPGKPAKILSAGTPAAPPSAAGKQVAAATPPSAGDQNVAGTTPAPGSSPKAAVIAGLAAPTPAAPRELGAPPSTAPSSVAPPARVEATAPHIDAVEAEAGHLFVQGTGEPGAQLGIYLNNAPVANAVVGPDGRWTLTIRRGLTPGHYQVRVDQLGNSGKVTARAAAPFDYQPKLAAAMPPALAPSPPATGHPVATMPPAVAPSPPAVAQSAVPSPPALALSPPRPPASGQAAASAPSSAEGTTAASGAALSAATPAVPTPSSAVASAESAPAAPPRSASPGSAAVGAANPVVERIGTVAIVKGDNLWTISRGIYGRGIRYTVIYAANQSQISDPDLIYPGQVFVVPPAAKAAPGVASKPSSG